MSVRARLAVAAAPAIVLLAATIFMLDSGMIFPLFVGVVWFIFTFFETVP